MGVEDSGCCGWSFGCLIWFCGRIWTRVCVCVYDETTALLMASAERKIIFYTSKHDKLEVRYY